MTVPLPPLTDLAAIGDQRTSALIGRDATIWWYTAHRFDGPALLLGLLDPAKGGWRVELPGSGRGPRRYIGESGVLETQLNTGGGSLTVTDWMNLGREARPGLLCRTFSRAPAEATILFEGWRDWGEERAVPQLVGGAAADAARCRHCGGRLADSSGVFPAAGRLCREQPGTRRQPGA